MKNKRNSERDDYRLLKNKLLIRTFGMLFFAFAFLAALYSLFLKGHIADTFVGFLDNFVYHDYGRAYNVYSIYIRDYMSLFFVVLSALMLTGLGDYVWKYVFVCWTGRVPYTYLQSVLGETSVGEWLSFIPGCLIFTGISMVYYFWWVNHWEGNRISE